ncbi:MAG: metalloregulator ArsR/SmtB family transcription factor [Melioribacteraceae bacterium]|nr:metalloregulator ArsR/SmtB family transcription factor [Melioribacteraceae bacterium]
MAHSKKDEFKKEEIEIAKIAKALSHPARIRILQILIKLDICMCGDIVEHLPLSQSTVSQHLKELKNSGLIKGSINPPKVCYCINKETFKNSSELINSFFKSSSKKLNRKKEC